VGLEQADLKQKRPLIVFSGGGLGRILLEEPFQEEETGRDMLKFYIVPTHDTVVTYRIDKKELITEPLIAGAEGYIIRRFPISSILRISTNPINPIVLCLCNFDGTEAVKTTKDLENIKEILDENEALRMENKRIKAARESEQIEHMQALAQAEEYRRRYLDQFKITGDLERVLGAFAKVREASKRTD